MTAPAQVAAEVSPADEEAAPWPEGSTSVSVEKVSADESPVQESSGNSPAAAEGPLPALETMVKRIPPEVREVLDDLFRVKFTGVQRLPASSLRR